jgi:DNA (cytosine-5)-methyltransferase 1
VAKTEKGRSRRRVPRALDLFAGCGGLTMGLRLAGFSVLGAVEIDYAAVKTFKANHRRVLVKHADIRDISPDQLRRELKLRRGQLDLLAGCPPCQGFSTLRTLNGAKRNRDRRNDLVREMLRFAQAFRPKAIMMENVPRLRERKAFKELCHELQALGYLLNVDVKDAARYGVPQRRRRLILVAGLGFEIGFARESSRTRTVRGAIGRIKAPGKSRDPLHNLPEKRRSAQVVRLIKDIPKNGGSRRDLPLSRQLKCHKKSDGFGDIYGRMAWERVAPTITSGCFNPSKGRFLHPEHNRPITMREAALLQSFPRNYKFDVSAGKEAVAAMIGNALPPEFVRRHALMIRNELKDRSKSSK